jgi:hypothetical protein
MVFRGRAKLEPKVSKINPESRLIAAEGFLEISDQRGIMNSESVRRCLASCRVDLRNEMEPVAQELRFKIVRTASEKKAGRLRADPPGFDFNWKLCSRFR